MNYRGGLLYIGRNIGDYARRRPFVFALLCLMLVVAAGDIFGPDVNHRDKQARDTTENVKVMRSVDGELVADDESKISDARVVKNSSWDGSVWQVEHHLKRNLNDPDSFEAIEWSEVIDNGDGFTVRCKYRAKNSFGGYVVEEQIFVMNRRGDVVSVSDWRRRP